ncbi:MAG: hypothetical protein JRH04_00040 [Deltaproteobacteria bacterium]|nr:hypothetical protein [Deltaproteobacteria bacterium]
MWLYSNSRAFHRFLRGICLVVSILILLGCSTASKKGGGQRRHKKISYDDRDAVILYLNEGLRLHYAGNFKESNLNLEKAEAKMEDLYTESISKKAASLMINDYTTPYRGEDFENVMTNLFMSLNYIFLEKGDDALVEARKVDNKLNVINARYEPDKKNVYTEDAFVRLIMGLLYEAENEMNEAFVSYRKAEEIYDTYENLYGVPAPGILLAKLVNPTSAILFEDELKCYRDKYPHIKPVAIRQSSQSGEVFFFHYNGLCPRKMEDALYVPMPDGYLFKIAVPRFKRRRYSIEKCEIVLRSKEGGKDYRIRTEVGEDIGSIAIQNLKNRMARIKAKAIARATAKYLATRAVGKVVKDEAGENWAWFVRSIMNFFATVTERADLRSCDILPDRIDVGHVEVPPGTYTVNINTQDASGNAIGHIHLPDIHVKAGQKRFVSFRTTR